MHVGDAIRNLPKCKEVEQKALSRIKAEPEVRLACQTRPRRNLAIRPLLPELHRSTPGQIVHCIVYAPTCLEALLRIADTARSDLEFVHQIPWEELDRLGAIVKREILDLASSRPVRAEHSK